MLFRSVNNYEEGVNLYNKLNVVVSKFLKIDIEFLGIVENDDNMSKSVIQQKPISMAYPNSKGARAFEKISDILLEMKTNEDEQKGLVQMFLKKFKRSKGGV